MRSWSTGAIASGLALTLALVGCGGGSLNQPDEQSLAELLGTPDPEILRGRVLVHQTSEQELVAECMKEQGFDYIPWVPPHMLPPVQPPEFSGLTDREVAERFGFGILTIQENNRSEAPDPNLAIYQSLDTADKQAYLVALEGVPSDSEGEPLSDDGVTVIVVDNAHRGGNSCRQKAFDALLPDDFPPPEVTRSYRELYADLQDRIDADPGVAAAWDRSQKCLIEAGIRSDSGIEPDPVGFFLAEAEALLSTPVYSADQLNSLVSDGLVDKASAARARDLERTLAVTTYDCMEEYDKVRADVSQRLEKEFVDENYSLIVEAAPGL